MEDRFYRAFIRLKPCVAAVALGNWSECEGVMNFCHRKHSGMGGKDVPDRANGFPGCSRHHDEYHKGEQTFEEKYGLDIDAICAKLDQEYEHGTAFLDPEPYGGNLKP